MKKQLVALLLALSVILTLFTGCVSNQSDPIDSSEPTQTETPESAQLKTEENPFDDPVFDRAKSYGFVPDDLWDDPYELITMTDFCRLLSGVIALNHEEKLPRWNELAAIAMKSEDIVQKDEALLALFETAIALDIYMNKGIGFAREPNWESLYWENPSPEQDWWKGASFNYPDFPNWEDNIADPTGWEAEIFLISALFAEQHRSLIDFSYIFPPEEDWTFGFGQDVTRKDAIRAVTIFAESDSIILKHAAKYVSLTEVETYDKSIITEELLSQPTDLPIPTQEHLPFTWCGAGLSHRKDAEHVYMDFRESDIRLLADNGFNFTRVFLDLTTLQYPYTNQDKDQVNLYELKELDQLIAWGMEYNVHIQIACVGFLGYKCQGTKEFDQLSDEDWALFSDYWEMLARRYEGIPSTYLSFDLVNEWSPEGEEEEQIQSLSSTFGQIAQTIWDIDGDRVVTLSFRGNPNPQWIEAIAAQGIGLGIHPYNPQQVIDRLPEENYAAEPVWPIPWFGSIMEPEEKLTITGNISGGTLKIYFEGAVQDALLNVYTDGELYETINPVSNMIDEYGDYREFEDAYTVDIPEGTQTLVLQSTENSRWIRYDGLQLEKEGKTVGIMPHDYQYYTNHADVNLYVDENGWQNSDGMIYDAESVYDIAIKPIIDISEKYHVGVVINEMGLFGNVDIGEAGFSYVDDLLSVLTKYELGWCFCEMEIGYLFSSLGDQFFILKDSPVGQVTYELENGETVSYWICERMVDILRKYAAA